MESGCADEVSGAGSAASSNQQDFHNVSGADAGVKPVADTDEIDMSYQDLAYQLPLSLPMESHLVDLRESLLSAADHIGEIQEGSRACERALLVVAAQSALRAARLSVDAVPEATDEVRAALGAALGRAEKASLAGDARTVAEALADVYDVIAPMSGASSARIDVTEVLILWRVSRVDHRHRETFEETVTEAFRRPLTSDVISQVHKEYWHRFSSVPGRFPSNNSLPARRSRRQRAEGIGTVDAVSKPAGNSCFSLARLMFALRRMGG